MAVYIKFTNGAVTQLINMNNEVAQAEAIENGFYMELDEDGVPEVVESKELLKGKSLERAEMLQKISEKLDNKNQAAQAKKTLSSKYSDR